VRTRLIVFGLLVIIAIVVASPAGAVPPTKTSGNVTDDVFAFSCGSFDVRDDFEFSWQGTEHYDRDGNLIRVVEQISGVDRLYNPLNGKSVSGTYYNSETVDLANGDVSQNGSIFRIIVPGSGALFIDVGKYVIDFDEGLTFLAGRHDFFDEDFAEICAYLA
jgi:hypothetical protein